MSNDAEYDDDGFKSYDDDDGGFNHIQFLPLPLLHQPKQTPTDVLIKKYSNLTAVKQMCKVMNRLGYDGDNDVGEFVGQWSSQIKKLMYGADLICYILTDSINNTIGFCLLSYTNKYPKYERTYIINYIYTTPTYRKQNFGYKLLSYIQKHHDTIAICMPSSFGLFEKSNYKFKALPKDGLYLCNYP